MKQRGLSLIELMMALAIGSFLIIGTVTVYIQSNAVYAVNETMARLQESARYALNTIEPDIQLAGFWGLTSEAQHIRGRAGNLPLALSSRASRCGSTFPLDLLHPLDGTNNAYALLCAATGGAQNGGDVIITRHAEPKATTASDERLQIYTSRNGNKDAVFRSNTAPDALTTDPIFGPVALVHDLSARAYYISRSSTGQTGFPSLRRKILEGGSANGPDVGDEEVMSGVEDLQAQFGIDPGVDADGDHIPDDRDADGWPDIYTGRVAYYVNPQDPALANAIVIAVRIWIRVRAETAEIGYADNKIYSYADVNFRPLGTAASYRRLLVSRTIQLRNAMRLQP